MHDKQILTPIALKADGVHTGEVKEVLIDQPLSLLVMLINRDTVFETMYCCDGLGDNKMPYIAFKFDYRLVTTLNTVFDKMNEYQGHIRTEIHIKYLRSIQTGKKQKSIVIRGVVGKHMLPKLSIDNKLTYFNILRDTLKASLLVLSHNIKSYNINLDTYFKVNDIIATMDYNSRFNQ